MTLNEFITKYNGKKVEYHSFSSGALYQCVDLANQYITEVLGLPAIIGTNAQDFPTKRGDNYDWILNSPTGVPSAGDLVIFKSPDGVGHISIFVEGDANSFKSFDQNYPTGSPSKIVTHNYKNVIGWLHPKGTMSDLHTYLGVTTDAEAKAKLNEHLGEKDGKCNWGMTGDKGGYLGSERKKNGELSAINAQLVTENQSHKTEIEAQKAKITQLEQDLADCEAEAPDNDLTGWVKNGLQVEVTSGNTKTITNYKPA